jgi:TolB protein
VYKLRVSARSERVFAGPGWRALSWLLVVVISGCGGDVASQHRRAEAPPRASSSAGPPTSGRPISLASLHGRVAFSHRDDIWVADPDGRHARRLTRGRGAEFDPSWSPDGRQIAYRDSRRGLNLDDEIYVVDAARRRRRNLTRSPSNQWSPAWSPDGRLIAFYDGQLAVMSADGSDQHVLTKVEGEYPAWAPDGKRIAFMSAEPGARGGNPNYDIFVANRDGSRLRKLTSWPGEDGWPAWSPDGHWIAFSTTHNAIGGARYALYVMRADGSGKHRLPTGGEGDFPVWAPDGKTIMFSSPRDSERAEHLWVIRPDGSGLRELPLEGWLADWWGGG